MEDVELRTQTPGVCSSGQVQADNGGASSGAKKAGGKAVRTKGTLSALWSNKKQKKMDVIDVTGDDVAAVEDVVVEENNTAVGEEFEIRRCKESSGGIEEKKEEHATECRQEVVDEVVREEPTKDEESPSLEEKVDEASKKRKRSTLPDDVVEALQTLFDSNPFPTKEEKSAFAEKYSLEVKRVSNWFERRRKTARSQGATLEKPRGSHSPEEMSAQPEQVESMDIDIVAPEPIAGPSLLSDEVLQSMVGMTRVQLEDDSRDLKSNGLLEPLQNMNEVQKPLLYSDQTLCKVVVGHQSTLTELVSILHPMFGEGKPTEESLRSSIIDLLVRKSYDPINKSVKRTDWLEWKNEAVPGNGLWQWEVRDRDSLPRSCQTAATAIKRRANKVMERLKAIDNLLNLPSDANDEKKERAAEAFKKSSSLAVLQAELESQRNAERSKEDKEKEKERQKAEREAAKAKALEEKKLALEAKEREKKEKEEAKARAAAERQAEKEKIKAEKAREKELKEEEKKKKKEEASIQKLAKKTGFKDTAALSKTANKFKSFFAASAPQKASEQDGGASCSKDAHLSYFERTFPKPPGNFFHPVEQVSLDEALTSQVDQETVMNEWKNFLKSSAAKFRATLKNRKDRYLGLPPSWAQKSNALDAAASQMEALTAADLSADMIQTWRRKFIWFPADSKRPPFYGSHSLPSKDITPRHPFGKEPTLDYEVMSDIDWEDEPEGSSLSKDSMQSDGANETGDEEDSFFVADGYLSADEGIQLDDEEDDGNKIDGDTIMLANSPSKTACQNKTAHGQSLALYLEKSRRSGKPLVIHRESVSANANHGACFQADPSLCAAMELEILLPGALFEVPEDPLAQQEAADEPKVVSPEHAKEVGQHAAMIVGGNNADLLPELSAYILEHSSATKPMLIEGFLQRHSERKLTKKWINESISLVATRAGSRWVMKEKQEVAAPEQQQTIEKTTSQTPLCTLKAPRTVEKNHPQDA